MEYAIGPIIALLISLKFSHSRTEENKASIENLTARVEVLENTAVDLSEKQESTAGLVDVIDKQTLAKMVTTLQPVSTAVNELQAFVGLK